MNLRKQGAPVSILLADDDIDDCFFFEKALGGVPIATHLTTVHDGEQLMEYLFENAENLPAILFLDLSMPRKTGFECLTEIRETEKFKDLSIVVFTTSFGRDIYYEQSLMNTLSNIGAQEYVHKTSEIGQLQEIIRKALVGAKEKASLGEKVEIHD